MNSFEPAYLNMHRKGVLKDRIVSSCELMKNCTLCPRNCRINRFSGETGICKTGKNAVVSSCQPHFGEEAPLVGRCGSGTIFFTYCNLLCNFCQNYDISHEGYGSIVDDGQLADMMLYLQNTGCHNINFVTPSHVVPQILSALETAINRGLNVPLVYNSGGYDSIKTLQLLDGIFDIYMPDFKFWDNDIAQKSCKVTDYREVVCDAVIEMHRQTGDLVISHSGVAERGLLIRHLVLPGGHAGTKDVMKFISQKVSKNTYVNVMAQYRPCGNVQQTEELNIRLSDNEFRNALEAARGEGITRIDKPYQ